MSDTSGFQGNSEDVKPVEQASEPLWQRLIYMLVFWLLGYVAFCLAIFLAAVQLVVLVINKKKNEEIAAFSRNLIRYVWECLAFIIFAQDEKPFPLANFPSGQ
jgi:hypothetical protein